MAAASNLTPEGSHVTNTYGSTVSHRVAGTATKFGMYRLELREHFKAVKIPGIQKSSWLHTQAGAAALTTGAPAPRLARPSTVAAVLGRPFGWFSSCCARSR